MNYELNPSKLYRSKTSENKNAKFMLSRLNRLRLFATALASLIVFGLIAFPSGPYPRVRAEGDRLDLMSRSLPSARPALKSLLSFPLAFEPNHGQADPSVKYFSRNSNSTISLTERGAILASGNSSFQLLLAAAGDDVSLKPGAQLPERRNYFIGNDPGRWQINVPTFAAVTYERIYPGIDLTYYGKQQQLEYDFVIHPGADVHEIRLAFDSTARVSIDSAGDLIVEKGDAKVSQRRPVIYQDVNGSRRQVAGGYVRHAHRQIGFEVGAYDKSKPLIIDPTIVYSTYLGGSGDDSGSSLAIDGSGNVYVAGTTASTNFPTHTPAFSSSKGLSDIFVTKIDPSGANILHSTYIGGSGLDRADGIAIDSTGNAYVVGRVGDTSIDFPTTAGALATTYRGGDFDGVVFKLNAAGNALVYSTFLGGEDNDSTEGIAVDSTGNAYITG